MPSRDRDLVGALEAGFIDDRRASDESLRPKLYSNNQAGKNKMLSILEKELTDCDDFIFSVAFISQGGLTTLLNALRTLKERGIRGRLLTSTYQYFNSPRTFRHLLSLSQILEVRIFQEDRAMHAKGYIFKRGEERSFIVGSSNLTQHALTQNMEWNIRVSSRQQGSLIKELEEEFEYFWQTSISLSEAWIADYEKIYQDQKIIDIRQTLDLAKNTGIRPNKMQREALVSLQALRKKGKDKALLISSTGTGKTYLSAFDVRDQAPRRFLFIIHRQNVAIQAMQAYQEVLGDEKNVGLLSGGQVCDLEKTDYIFATIQSLAKDHRLQSFARDHFDYIVVDEVHRAGAPSYQKVLGYFKPGFLLGMSATPERTDGFQVSALFDHNIAYEIRLQEAMQYNLLCPFHYFAVHELKVEGEEIGDHSRFSLLLSEQRVSHIIENINFYGHAGNRARGLIFCRSTQEAKALSLSFNDRGYRTLALTGSSSEEDREEAVERLEKEERTDISLDYIFTVDIFNEGVDIPQVNQIIMLRPTQSSIIFIQQLGRGLRKARDKSYVVVLDFIGNYSNNYMIPLALSGSRTYNKDDLRRFAHQPTDLIQGLSTIHFDRVIQGRIYESINRARFSTHKLMDQEYGHLKKMVGQVPDMMDFYRYGAFDLQVLHEEKGSHAYKSYLGYLKKKEADLSFHPSTEQEILAHFISHEVARAIRLDEILLLEYFLDEESLDLEAFFRKEKARHSGVSLTSLSHALIFLTGEFLTKVQQKKYQGIFPLKKDKNGSYRRTSSFRQAVSEKDFRIHLEDLLSYCRERHRREYVEVYPFLVDPPLVIKQKYSRKEVCQALCWPKDESSTIYGYKFKRVGENYYCPIFITYHKKEGLSQSICYEDAFLSPSRLNWMTRNNVSLDSKDVDRLKKHKEDKLQIMLFVKKSDDEGLRFFYLGRMTPRVGGMEETQMLDDKQRSRPVVRVTFDLARPVSRDIYDYLTQA